MKLEFEGDEANFVNRLFDERDALKAENAKLRAIIEETIAACKENNLPRTALELTKALAMNEMEKFYIRLFDTRDGSEKEIEQEFSDYGIAQYMYKHGNYACDCNRSLFMYRDEPEKILDCNYGNNQILVSVTDKDGDVVYQDFIKERGKEE